MSVHLNSIQYAFQDFVFILTDEGFFSDYNVGESSDITFLKDDCIGKHYSDVVSPDLQSKIEKANRYLKNGADKYKFEFSIEEKGEVIWFSAFISGIMIEGKHHFLVVARNFTDRKINELLLDVILNSPILGILTFRAVRNSSGKIIDFKISEINEAGRKMLGVSEDEALEMSLLKNFSGNRSNKILKKYISVIETGITKVYTYKFTNRTDSTFWLRLSVAKYMNGVVVTIQDITEQRNRELGLQESVKKYKSIFEKISDVFYRTDVNGVVVEISPSIERYTDFKREQIIGKQVIDFYHNREDRVNLIEKLSAKGEVIDFEVRLKKKQGNLAYASVNAYVVSDDSGRVEGIEGYMRDISERKIAEEKLVSMNEQLRDLNLQKNKLFSVIAHDLRNAILGVASLSNIMVDEFENLPKEEMFEYVSLLNKNMENSSELLNDLLLWAGNQFKEVSINLEKLNLHEMTISVFELFKEVASKKMITFDNKVPDHLNVHADPNIFKIILRNLISNSIKFSHPGSSITVSAETKKEKVQIAVKDQGVGMGNEVLSKIFNKHTYHSTSGTKGEKGSGLGLELCHSYVKKLSGEIWAESEHGAGSTFYFTVPLLSE